MLDRDVKFAQFKIASLQYVTVALFFVLATGFWRLQISQPDYYRELADQNSIKNLPVPAPRGRIVDREGRMIAGNVPSFSILLLREQFKNLDTALPAIAAGLDLDAADLRALVLHRRSAPHYEPVIIKEAATLADLAFIESHHDEFPGLEHIMVSRRLYPRDGFLAHLLGYVGEVSENELDLPQYSGFRSGQIVGKTGIEREYNDILMGQDGYRRVIVNNRGREVGKLEQTDSKAGNPLRLTIDLDLQAAAEEAMEGKNGAVVAIDPRSGEILAMVSRPTFDPNKFAVRIKREDWKELAEDQNHPLMNKTIQAQLAPGSTFKIIMTIAGLETDTITPDTAFNCAGSAVFYGRPFKCHTKGGHGHIELHRAIVQSCDVFFYNVGQRLGIDKIAFYATHLGLGSRTGIDLPSEEPGVIPSTAWKLKTFREKWYAGETISVAIGQGSVQVTPLQLAYALGGIASGGYFHRPHTVFPEDVKDWRPDADLDHTTYFPISEIAVEQATSGMWGVVNEGGTATRARLVGIDIGGKTGTAQVASNDLVKARKGSDSDEDLRDTAWFVGISPHRNPEIAVTALLEHGETSANATPIVREVVRAYWEKKNRQKAPGIAVTKTEKPAKPVAPAPGGTTLE
jgi:penicillin-binding protein 2